MYGEFYTQSILKAREAEDSIEKLALSKWMEEQEFQNESGVIKMQILLKAKETQGAVECNDHTYPDRTWHIERNCWSTIL